LTLPSKESNEQIKYSYKYDFDFIKQAQPVTVPSPTLTMSVHESERPLDSSGLKKGNLENGQYVDLAWDSATQLANNPILHYPAKV